MEVWDMLYREAVSTRVLELMDIYDLNQNSLAKAASIPPTTLFDLINCKVANPSSYAIYQICKCIKIELAEFYDNKLFDYKNIID